MAWIWGRKTNHIWAKTPDLLSGRSEGKQASVSDWEANPSKENKEGKGWRHGPGRSRIASCDLTRKTGGSPSNPACILGTSLKQEKSKASFFQCQESQLKPCRNGHVLRDGDAVNAGSGGGSSWRGWCFKKVDQKKSL